ncbi:MAG: amidohydrolase family protein [Rhodoglobus sp.]
MTGSRPAARRLSAAWVIPMDGPPIRRGAVLIGADGRFAAVGTDAEVPAPAAITAEDFPSAAILPGLVNTHTHLELTGLARDTEPEFAAWVRRIRQVKATRTPADFLAAARRGLADCFAAGVTTIADTGDSGAVIEALAEAGGSGIAYHEVFGPHPDQLDESFAGFRARITELRRFESSRVRLGASPHAPYSVSGPLYRAVSQWARHEHLPVAVHVSESADESRLLADGTGAFADAWAQRGIPRPRGGSTPLEWLDEHGVLGRGTLCIHAVRASASDISLMKHAGCSVAHCPLSNRAHGHGEAPLAAFLAAGLTVGVGTDSAVSVGKLDLLAEVRAARALASLDAGRALRLCTIDAARALGLDSEVGSIQAGKWGDVAVFEVGRAADPLEAVLASGADAVLATCLAGHTVYCR